MSHEKPQNALYLYVFAIIAAIIVALGTHTTSARPVLITDQQLTLLRDDAKKFKPFQTICTQISPYTPNPIADYSPPAYYSDKEGHTNYFGLLFNDAANAYYLAVCYRVTGKADYAKSAQNILDSWAGGVEYIEPESQAVKDFSFAMYLYIMAADLIQKDPTWDSSNFDAFLTDRLMPLWEWTAKAPNNIASWTVLEWAMTGAYLHDTELLTKAKTRWSQLITSQIAEDGSMPMEICRTDSINECEGADKGIRGLAYTHWALFPLVLSAEVFHHQGLNIYPSPEALLLKKAYDKAAAWTRDPTTFPYYTTHKEKLFTPLNIGHFYILQTRIPNDDAQFVLDNNAPEKIGLNPLKLHLLYPLSGNGLP